MNRRAACVLPIAAVRRADDWGIGDLTGMVELAPFLVGCGMRAIQVLPPHTMPDGETSPYGAETAFALDPIYLDLARVAELATSSILADFARVQSREIEALRSLATCDYTAVRALKRQVLDTAYELFCALPKACPRRDQYSVFCTQSAAWLDGYANYVHAHSYRAQGARPLADRVRYEQFLMDEQWRWMRGELAVKGLQLWGDVPFIVGRASADVRGREADFRPVSLGVPPDAFSADGQDWGLPAYAMSAMAAQNYAFLRARTERAAQLYDAFRVDHVVGYFRQWIWTTGADGTKHGEFDVHGDDAQRARGRAVLQAMQSALGASRMFAEDLGVIPPFVREVLRELGIAGYKIVPWEAYPHVCDPRGYPELSVAAYGTHDTPPLLAFWDELPSHVRDEIRALAHLRADEDSRAHWSKLLTLLAQSPADTVMVLVTDLFGSRERINTPGTVGSHNWSYRIPKTAVALAGDTDVQWHQNTLRTMMQQAGRL
jgi:4-alpha-glucanotransferase